MTELQAANKIQEVQHLVGQVKELLKRSGSKNEKQSLVVRFESILAQPLIDRSDPNSMSLRKELIDTYATLEALLTESFRIKQSNP